MNLDGKNDTALADASQESDIIDQLTLRERDILCWLGDGKTDREIATSLGLSERTVQHHVQSVFAKLNTKNRTHAVVKALRMGLIELNQTLPENSL